MGFPFFGVLLTKTRFNQQPPDSWSESTALEHALPLLTQCFPVVFITYHPANEKAMQTTP